MKNLLIHAFSSAWEIHFKSLDTIGANMAEFAPGSLATMVERNPPIQLPDSIPQLGTRLNVHWRGKALPLLGSIAALHLVLLLLVFYFTRNVETPDSNLEMAQVWRPLLEGRGWLSATCRKRGIGLIDAGSFNDNMLVIYGPAKGSEGWTLHPAQLFPFRS